MLSVEMKLLLLGVELERERQIDKDIKGHKSRAVLFPEMKLKGRKQR